MVTTKRGQAERGAAETTGQHVVDITDFCYSVAARRIAQQPLGEPLALSQYDAEAASVHSEVLDGAQQILSGVPSYNSLMIGVNRHIQRAIMGAPIPGDCDGMNITYRIPANPDKIKNGMDVLRRLQQANLYGIPVDDNVRLYIDRIAKTGSAQRGDVALEVRFRVAFTY